MPGESQPEPAIAGPVSAANSAYSARVTGVAASANGFSMCTACCGCCQDRMRLVGAMPRRIASSALVPIANRPAGIMIISGHRAQSRKLRGTAGRDAEAGSGGASAAVAPRMAMLSTTQAKPALDAAFTAQTSRHRATARRRTGDESWTGPPGSRPRPRPPCASRPLRARCRAARRTPARAAAHRRHD